MSQFKEVQGKLVFLKPLQTSGDLAAPCDQLPRYLAAGNGNRSLRIKLGNKDSLTASGRS